MSQPTPHASADATADPTADSTAGPDSELRARIEDTIRFMTLDAVGRANSGHVGAPLGLACAAFELWDKHLRFDPQDPHWPLRDRFVLSNGHASMLQYALLSLYGMITPEDVAKFRNLGSRTPGHPEYGDTPGVEVTTGPLGQGFAHAVGMALAGRLTRSQYGVAPGDSGTASGLLGPGEHFVYGFLGDGDLMEGISSEAGSLAGHLRLGNLIFLYDDNEVTIDGSTAISFGEDARGRFEAQGWHVESVSGKDPAAVSAALARSRSETERPSLIITKTDIGQGVPSIVGTAPAHGNPIKLKDLPAVKEAAGWPVEPLLHVPEDVKDYFGKRVEAMKSERAEADRQQASWRSAHPERAAAWERARARALPENLAELLCEGMAGVDKATRQHSADVLQKLAQPVPFMVGGSADLAGSLAPPNVQDVGMVGPAAGDGADPFAGRNICFGVREHAMAALTNGIALDGTFVPYCGTFLIFSDYMRPAIRLAALMKVPSVFVFTHDSIFVGEDGPTHQPVEQLDGLRLVPDLTLFRPADGVETAMAWAWILEQAEGPAVLSLSRQKVKALARDESFDPQDVWRGAYTVREAEGTPRVVLLASGSEVSLACDAAEELAAGGVAARVVSIPCFELFAQQAPEYQEALLPDDGTLLVGVEAGRAESYRRWVGRNGMIQGMATFGASGPYGDLAEKFGFTKEALVARIRERLAER